MSNLFDNNDENTNIDIDTTITKINKLVSKLKKKGIDNRIQIINSIKIELHKISPFVNEPVDCVLWVNKDDVQANDYNPNAVAPPEMELLKISILNDGFTQPIVTWPTKKTILDKVKEILEVIDGFHRNRVGKEYKEITKRLHGYLPIVKINNDRIDKGDRMAATIRHNRARGKHRIDAMSEIVLDLKKRNWKDEKIAKELGMEPDEVLRLAQITGLAEMFKDQEFSQAWEADTTFDEIDRIKETK